VNLYFFDNSVRTVIYAASPNFLLQAQKIDDFQIKSMAPIGAFSYFQQAQLILAIEIQIPNKAET